MTTVHTRWFFLPQRSLTGAPLFRSPLPCNTQDSKSTGQTVGAFTVFQCERVLKCMTKLCQSPDKDLQIYRSCRGGNTEPPALVRHTQNNGKEIVQPHEDCEIVN